jgi:2-amino-4-hydroxy-6-hydroxymethyldihydropteridine diphosphokinase
MIYINIGSNLNSQNGNRTFNIQKTIDLIRSEKIKIIKKSSIYETPSYPNKKNPKFLNICIQIESTQKPQVLLKKFKIIEKKLQRIKGLKNQPRTCDIDIIDYKGKQIKSKNLTIPHPRAHLRNFVLFPLREISSEWTHPSLNKKIGYLINKLKLNLRNEITKIKETDIIDND